MKYRLVELLQCPRCHGDLEVREAQTAPAAAPTAGPGGASFSCQRYCGLERTQSIPSPFRCVDCGQTDIRSGSLLCLGCGKQFQIVQSVPWMFEPVSGPSGRLLSDTMSLYSHVWSGAAAAPAQEEAHVEVVEESLNGTVVRGALGLDAGSGSGGDTAAMARRHPSVEIISLDMSEGVYETRARTLSQPNVHVVRGSVLTIPVKSGVCDFVYSFGVLHHTTDPKRGLAEIVRTLKPGGLLSLYLYENHADNPWKAWPLKVVSALRLVTTRLPPRLLSLLCYGLSPFVILAFSLPARIMARCERTKPFADRMPFNFGTSPFSVQPDLMDRLGAPIEERYGREEVAAMMQAGGLAVHDIVRLKRSAGWVARGEKIGRGVR